MNDTRQNWVLARANCTLQDSFDAIKNAVDLDVREFNSLSPHKRKERNFLAEKQDLSIRVSRAAPAAGHPGNLVPTDIDDVVRVQKEAECIMAYRKSHWAIEICPEWNEETLTCDILIEGEPYTPWQISQKILADFLFPKA